jgi:hypothetical protein
MSGRESLPAFGASAGRFGADKFKLKLRPEVT